MSLTTEFFNFGRKKSENLSFKNGHFSTNSCHFFANYINIFHKNEVQTVILRCFTVINLDWFKLYGLRCKWRPRRCSANFQKIANDKWPFYYYI